MMFIPNLVLDQKTVATIKKGLRWQMFGRAEYKLRKYSKIGPGNNFDSELTLASAVTFRTEEIEKNGRSVSMVVILGQTPKGCTVDMFIKKYEKELDDTYKGVVSRIQNLAFPSKFSNPSLPAAAA